MLTIKIKNKMINCANRFEGICRLDASAYGKVQINDILKMRQYLKDGSCVLDIGCGFGIPTSQAAEYFDMYACDMLSDNEGAYKYTKNFIEMIMIERLKEAERFKWSKPIEIPFPDNMFDGLLLYAVIEHIPNKYKQDFLKECSRILKPGGYAFFYRAVNVRSITEKIVSRFGLPTHGNDVVSYTQMDRLFSNSLFNICDWGYQGWLPENKLSRFWIYWINKILCAMPIVNLFSHDYWFICQNNKKSEQIIK